MSLLVAGCAPAVGEAGGDGSGDVLPTLQVTRTDDTAYFALDLTNTGSDDVTANFRDGQSAEFEVFRGSELIWRWSDGQMFTQAVRRDRLEPGATRRYEAVWEVPTELSGEFVATGRWLATDHSVEQSTRFTLP